MMDDRAVGKVWRIVGWVILALLLAVGALARAFLGLNRQTSDAMEATTQQQDATLNLCIQQLEKQTGISGKLDKSWASGGFGTRDLSVSGSVVNTWRYSGALATAEGKSRPFTCSGSRQGNKFTILDVHFSP